jgi:prepilin-type N-terminal cleavage/methylation domain-containing protein
MKISRQTSLALQAGFSLIELALVCAILAIVLASVFSGISLTIQRSEAEQTKVDLTQGGREFVDEFERDLHQAGYPNCRIVATAGVAVNCPADYLTNPTVASNSAVAAGLVSVSNTQLIFEGDMDGSGTVYSVQYRVVDSAGNYPPSTTCPCTIQRSERAKWNGTMPLLQPTTFSQELQNVVNSGVPTGSAAYGNGLQISGNTAWGASNTSYYAAISSFKDYPVFQAYDQFGNIIQLNPAVTIQTAPGVQTLTCAVSSVSCVKSIRLTINLLANATTGADLQTKVRPVSTWVGNARLVNN